MNELEKQLRERETNDLQNALRNLTLTVDAVDIAKVIFEERDASIPDGMKEWKHIKGKQISKYLRYLPIMVLLIFVPVHLARNAYFESLANHQPANRIIFSSYSGTEKFNLSTGMSEIVHPPNQLPHVVEITPNDIIKRTGSWSWRFFQWGIRTDGDTLWCYIVGHDISHDVARATDITNPTPFMLFIFSCVIILNQWHNNC